MKAIDIFKKWRGSKKKNFSLNLRLSLLVCAEMVVAVLVVFGVDEFLRNVVFQNFEFPILAEVAIIGITIIFFSTHAVSVYFFSPLKEISNAMAKVAEGDFSVRLESRSTAKEIQEVYSGFNMMASELQSIEILKTDFISEVSHEIKTPACAIEGYATLLSGAENLDGEQEEYVSKILLNTRRLSSLTGNILLLSRLENQSIPTNRTHFLLDEQIRQAIVALEPFWEKKDIEFEAEMDESEYFGCESLTYHVWVNLISNAIKFSPKGGVVRVSIERCESFYEISVSDDGPGVPDEAKKRIFDKFYQADTSHKTEGNGLGLALVKEIVTAEGGEILLGASETGAKFIVRLGFDQKA
jgi:signal transduction histidine kinase